jgi:hypothetical protein
MFLATFMEVNCLDVIEFAVDTAKGAFAGVVASGIGYVKRPENEKFNAKKFTKTVITGGVVGAIGSGLNVPIETAETYAALPLVVYGIDAAVTVVARKVVTPVFERLKPFIEVLKAKL